MIMNKNWLKYYTNVSNILICVSVLMIILNAVVPATMAAQSADKNPKIPLLITFKSTATSADIDTAIQASGGNKGRFFGPIRTQEIGVSSNAQDNVIAAFSKHASVERVEVAGKRKVAGIPNDLFLYRSCRFCVVNA
jgi:hypothetical protein